MLALDRAEQRRLFRRHPYISRAAALTPACRSLSSTSTSSTTNAEMAAYIARLSVVDEALDQLIVRARAAAADGIRPEQVKPSYDRLLAWLEEDRKNVAAEPAIGKRQTAANTITTHLSKGCKYANSRKPFRPTYAPSAPRPASSNVSTGIRLARRRGDSPGRTE